MRLGVHYRIRPFPTARSFWGQLTYLKWKPTHVITHELVNWLLMFTLTTSVGQTSGRCITQLAKISIDPKFTELTADVFGVFFKVRPENTYSGVYGRKANL